MRSGPTTARRIGLPRAVKSFDVTMNHVIVDCRIERGNTVGLPQMILVAWFGIRAGAGAMKSHERGVPLGLAAIMEISILAAILGLLNAGGFFHG